MARTGLLVSAIAVACYVLINLLVTTELERVEAEVERLVALAVKGGDDAADELMAAFADDYRGTIPLDRIADYVRRFVRAGKIRSLTTNSYKTLWVGEEIQIPIFIPAAKLDGWELKPVITVVWAERDGTWKIVEMYRLRWG